MDSKSQSSNILKLEEKKEKLGISKLYSHGLSFMPEKLDNSLTDLKGFEKVIKEQVENITNIDILKQIYSLIGELTERTYNIDEVEIDSSTYYGLKDFSKRKLLVNEFMKRYPDKNERKKVLANAIKVNHFDGEIVDGLKEIGADPLIINMASVFSKGDVFSMLTTTDTFNDYMDDENKGYFIELLKSSSVSPVIISKFEDLMEKSEEAISIDNSDNIIDSEDIKSLISINSSERKNSSDFNPMIYDLTVDLGLKIFSSDRFKEIYRDLFYKIVSDLVKAFGGTTPSFNQLLMVEGKKLEKNNKEDEKEKNNNFFQYIIEWDIDDDLSEKELKEIVKMINIEGYNLNNKSIPNSKPFIHPIRTNAGAQEYKGHFENNGSGFKGDSLITIENTKGKEKKLRLTLNYFTQDYYTYLLTQISYYIKNRKFINKNQLYFNIYDRYNKEIYGSDKSYDISFFEEQYKTLMEKLIIPLSIEGKELGLKAQNTLLAGIYGSGKSQFLLNVLKNKKFEINGNKFNLNANVVYLDLQSFKSMLASPIGGIKTKLDNIYQNTKTPILLVIEDIDTLVNEKINGKNDEIAQAMTIFFEGIGSIPLNVLTTANDPSKFSERLIRPNRIYEIIEFYLPDEKEKEGIFNLHLQENNIVISTEIKEKLKDTKVFKSGTASHISAFCEQLKSKIDIKKLILDEDYILSENEIIETAENINISCEDIEITIKSIKEWIKLVTGKPKQKVGF